MAGRGSATVILIPQTREKDLSSAAAAPSTRNRREILRRCAPQDDGAAAWARVVQRKDCRAACGSTKMRALGIPGLARGGGSLRD